MGAIHPRKCHLSNRTHLRGRNLLSCGCFLPRFPVRVFSNIWRLFYEFCCIHQFHGNNTECIKILWRKKNKHNIRGNPVYPKVINIFYSQKLSKRTATGLFMAQRIQSKSNINLVISVGANQGLIKSQATNQSPSHYKNQLLHKTVTPRPKRDLFHNP